MFRGPKLALLFEGRCSTDFSREGNGSKGWMNWDKWITKPVIDFIYHNRTAALVDTSGINLARQNPAGLLVFFYFNIHAASAKTMISLIEFWWLKRYVCNLNAKMKFIYV